MELETIILAFLVTALGIYYWAFRSLNFFENHGVPYLPGLPLLGNMAPLVFRKKTLAQFVTDVYNHEPEAKYIGIFNFTKPLIVVRDLELMKSICIKSASNFPDHQMMADEIPDPLFRRSLFGLTGDEWHNMRTVLSPAFTSSKMKFLFKLLHQSVQKFTEHLSIKCSEPKVMEMRDLFNRLTNDVLMSSAFGIEVNSLNEPDNECYKIGRSATNFEGLKTLKLFLLRMFPRLARFLNVKLWSSNVTKFYSDIVKSAVTTRDARGIVRPDMLQLLMNVRDQKGKFELTIDDMASQAFIFYFGGADTSAILTTFAAHSVGVNPEIQERLQAEVDAVLAESGGNVTYEALQSMTYLDAIINETLRVYSPATILDRLCRVSFELPPALPGGKSFTVQPGTAIWIPAHAIHRDPKYYTDGETFDPDRWMDSRKSQIDPDTYIPFGIGPRFCIGNRFALMEAKLVLFSLMAKFDLVPCSKTTNPIEFSRKSFTIAPSDGVWFAIRKRETL